MVVCALSSLLALCQLSSPDVPVEVQELIASDGVFLERFGNGVDMEGDRIAIGAELGERAWIFERGPDLWYESAELVAPDVLNGDSFGAVLQLSGNTIIVGSPRHDTPNGSEAGAAYVFHLSGGVWSLQQKLTGSLAQPFDRVGRGVTIQDDCIILASLSPHAYVFERTGSTWSEEQVLTLTDGGDAFSVALEGGTLVVGSPTATFGGSPVRGAAYVFGHDGFAWQLQTILRASTTNTTSDMGWIVGVSGDTVVSTSILENVPGQYDGAAYVFRRSGLVWNEEAKLASPQGALDRRFGRFADIEGDRIAVSEETNAPPLEPQTCYLFERSGTQWSVAAPITPAPAECDGVLCRVPPTLADPWLVVGATSADGVVDDTGAAFVYLFPEDPAPYCTGKVNSQGCLPQVSWSGSPGLTGPDDFVVSVSQTLPGKNGVFFFGTNGPATLPFSGGTLCVTPPVKRTAPQQASPGRTCAGMLAHLFDQAEMALAGLDPGETAHGQFWMRDPQHPDGTGVGLSNGLEVLILP